MSNVNAWRAEAGNISRIARQMNMNFRDKVEVSIGRYFLFKYGISNIRDGVENLRLDGRFNRVMQQGNSMELYYDGEYLFLSADRGSLERPVTIVEHWVNK